MVRLFTACVAAAVMCATLAMAEATHSDAARLTVTGEGRVSAAPDMATFTLSVMEQDDLARDAMRQASVSVQAILDRLDATGIAPKDRQTSGLTLDPIWSNRASSSPEGPRVTGYTARSQLTVRVRDLEQLGPLLDAVLVDGANGFGGVQFGVADPQPLEDAARKAAVLDAMRKAQLLADAAGVGVGPILSLSTGGGGHGPRPMMARAEMMSDGAVPVAAGEVSYSATVTMVFEISQ